MDWTKVSTGLRRPFGDEDVYWRIDRSFGAWARVLCYVDARAVMDRLDSVVGVGNWKDSYAETTSGKNICTLSICVDGEWVSKSDGAGNTNIEGDKGGLSDAFKRAGVKWGIGRHLYSLGETKINLSPDRPDCAKHYLVLATKRGDQTKYGVAPSVRQIQADLFSVEEHVAHIPEAKERRLSRLRMVMRRDRVSSEDAGTYLEALTAIVRGEAWEQAGLQQCSPGELPDNRLKVISQRAVRWHEKGPTHQKIQEYRDWLASRKGGE